MIGILIKKKNKKQTFGLRDRHAQKEDDEMLVKVAP